MKKIYLLLITLMLGICLNAQNMAVIEQELQEVINQKGDGMISVNIILKSQIDNEKLISQLNNIKAKDDKREIVKSELKKFATSNQADVMSILQSEERSLNVVDIQSHWMVNMINCTATKDVIYYLSEHPDVFIIGHNKFEKLIDDVTPVKAEPKRGMVENVTKVGANEVWEEGYTGEGVIVAVLDTGVNTDHVDLADHLWDGGSAYPGHGWNCVENNANTKDFNSHGTHCAGTICGDGTSGTQTGMAPDATLMCIKILNDNGEGTFNDFVEGVEFAIDNGADVMSISVGWRYPNVDVSEGMRTLFENVLSAGVVASVAAGNDRDMIGSYPVPRNINSPGNCPPPWLSPDQEANPGGLSAVVCVGAVDYSDVSAYFSSQGPVRWSNTQWGDYPYNTNDDTQFGLIRPDVSAPGVDIISAAYDDNSGFYYMSGTSMATPCVAGVMALLLDKNPELTPADICRALETTATPLDNKKSNLTGSGRINALAAIEDMGDDAPVTSYDFENGMGRWTSINANNDSHTWFHSNDSDEHSNSNITPHTGTGCMLNESYCYGYSPELVIGEGTSTIAQLPIYEYYSYTLSQQIYTADEMQGANGEITSVSFRQKQEYADTRHVDIYMMNTTKENFNTVSDWMTVSEDNLVYSGEIDYSSMEDGWMSIQLDNTFQYTGDNVLLCMVDNTGSWRNATEFYSYQTGSASRALYAFTDNAPYDPFNPSYTGNLSDYNTQVKFNFASVSLGNITPDDYLVSPKKIVATDNSKISFWACGREASYSQEHFGVAVSTTGKTSDSDFTTISEWTINASKYGDAKPREGNGAKSDNTTWIRYEADLSQYAGQEIWVAIRHFDCEGQSALCIDDVEIIRYVEEVGNHWNPDPTLYANNMTLIASVSINGEIQSNLDLELGAFCGEEVRGSVKAQYVTAPVNKYEFFLMIYGNANDVITFRLYDHNTHTELDLTSNYSLSFVVNGSVGDVTSPQIVNFSSMRYITLVSNIEGAGVLSGEGEYCTGDTVTIYASANDGYVFRNWTLDDVVVSYDTYYGFYASEDATYMANFEYLQQEELNSGWNWYSTYITVEGEDGLEMMKEGLGEDAVQIKNHSAFANYELGIWYGGLKEMSNEEMYMIKMSSPNTLEMTGTYDDPSSHPITLGTNWKWIGYPVNAAMSVDEAFSNITPNNGDYVKSQSHFAQYYEGLGWTGTLSVMEPGNGYMYQNTSGTIKTLVYPTPSSKEAVASNVTTEDYHWTVDCRRYPTNMTVIAVVEGAGSNYEVAAFSNGECRGSAKSIYVEQLDSYMIFMTVYGEDNDKMSFRFYDAENDEEYAINESMIFKVDASVGDVMDAYMMTIAATDMNETLSFSIYPNPVGGKEEIRLGGEYDVVEVYNSIGVKVAEYKNVSKIDGLETSGVYVIKIVEDDKIAYDRIVVK